MLWGQPAPPPVGLRRRRPPPRPPRPRPPSLHGDVVGKTVEQWARAAASRRATRPIVFGGTFPIDEPESVRLRATVERSVQRFETLLARRSPPVECVRTFAIDEPLCWGGADPLPRDPDARYYVAGPETFDVDEPAPY